MEDNIEKRVYYFQGTGPLYNGLKFIRGLLRQAQLQKISIGASGANPLSIWESSNTLYVLNLLSPCVTGPKTIGARQDWLYNKRFL